MTTLTHLLFSIFYWILFNTQVHKQSSTSAHATSYSTAFFTPVNQLKTKKKILEAVCVQEIKTFIKQTMSIPANSSRDFFFTFPLHCMQFSYVSPSHVFKLKQIIIISVPWSLMQMTEPTMSVSTFEKRDVLHNLATHICTVLIAYRQQIISEINLFSLLFLFLNSYLWLSCPLKYYYVACCVSSVR